MKYIFLKNKIISTEKITTIKTAILCIFFFSFIVKGLLLLSIGDNKENVIADIMVNNISVRL